MGALPKRKIYRGRRDRRRSHMSLQRRNLVTCPQCRNLRLPHHVCPNCGYYRGTEVIEVEAAESK